MVTVLVELSLLRTVSRSDGELEGAAACRP
jgi:hypothetical protein